MKKKKFMIVLLSVLLSFFLVGCGAEKKQKMEQSSSQQAAQQSTLELKIADYMPPTHIVFREGIQFWSKRVEELAGSRVTFKLFPSEQLGKAADLLNVGRTGMADIVQVSIPYVAGKMPLSGVVGLPSIYENALIGTAAYWKISNGILLENEFLKNGIRPVVSYALPPYEIWTTKKKVKLPDDMKGLKIRTAGGPQELSVKVVGGVPTTVAAPEMYEAIQRGTLDGAILATNSVRAYKLDELLKYGTWGSGMPSVCLAYCINEKVWQGLPEDVREAMKKASEETVKHLGEALDKDNEALKKDFASKGIVIVELTPEEQEKWKKVVSGIWNEWAEDLEKRGLPGKKVLTEFLQAIDQAKKES